MERNGSITLNNDSTLIFSFFGRCILWVAFQCPDYDYIGSRQPQHFPCLFCHLLTPVENGTLMGQLAMVLQRGAVPALVFELVLAFVNSNLNALQSRGCDIRAAHTQTHLFFGHACQSQTHCIGGKHWLSCHLQAEDVTAQDPDIKR